MSFKVVRTRVAPSPTGIAHVGTLYIALFNYAFAKQNNGQFIVRSEDTDRSRYVESAEELVLSALKWAGITPDEDVEKGGPYGPYRQSERLEIYQRYAQKLVAAGQAYYCFATPEELRQMREEQMKAGRPPKYDGRYRDYPLEEAKKRIDKGESHVIRLKVPSGKTKWHDLIRGEVEIDHQQIDDQVLIKSDGYPTYHLAVVVDDHLMKISHIIRGEEWISSTPKHIILYDLFGWEKPQFAHMPLLRNRDKSKLSKRKNDVSISSYQQQGILPEALINYLMLLGWSHPQKKEVISLLEFVNSFTFDRMQKTGPVFDTEKLRWLNGKYIREIISTDDLIKRLHKFISKDFPTELTSQVLPLIRERLFLLSEFDELTDFFYQDIQIDKDLLIKKADAQLVSSQIETTVKKLESISNWSAESIEKEIRNLQAENNWQKSQFFMMLRLAVTGKKQTPPLFETMAVIDRTTVLKRLQQAKSLII